MTLACLCLDVGIETARLGDLGQTIRGEPKGKDHTCQSRGSRKTGWAGTSIGRAS